MIHVKMWEYTALAMAQIGDQKSRKKPQSDYVRTEAFTWYQAWI